MWVCGSVELALCGSEVGSSWLCVGLWVGRLGSVWVSGSVKLGVRSGRVDYEWVEFVFSELNCVRRSKNIGLNSLTD